jgi:hypothetical protein
MRSIVWFLLLIPATAFADGRKSAMEPGTLGLGHFGVRVGFGVSPDAPSLGGAEVMVGLGTVDLGLTIGGLGFAEELGTGVLPGASLQAVLAELEGGNVRLSTRVSLQLATSDEEVDGALITGVGRVTFGESSGAFCGFADALVTVAPDREGGTVLGGAQLGVMAVGEHAGVYLSGGVGIVSDGIFPLFTVGVLVQ